MGIIVRIILAGSREWADADFIEEKLIEILSWLHADGYSLEQDHILFINGAAAGVDQIGEKIAKKWRFPTKQFPADWDEYGNSAGVIRNNQMAAYAADDPECGVLIAFWNGKSPGTFQMIQAAEKFHLKKFVVFI